MPAATLELRGFSAERGRFLLTTASASSAVSPRVLERDLVDLQSWDRLLHHSSSSSSQQRLPTKRLRKLMASNWVRGDRAAGWRVELQKNVRACEDWINSAFAQLSTPQQLEFLDDGLYAAAKRKRAAARADSKHARDLQQYFTSAELVDLVLEQVKQRLDNQEDLVWLEPSCGDGRFLTALLRADARHVVGYEIDERVYGVAKAKVQEHSDRAQVLLGDFLSSESSLPADKFVVAVGNPPFGAKGGDGSDLVQRFFRHAASKWRAQVIAFIVPERCARPAFMHQTLQQLGDDWRLVSELPVSEHPFEFGSGPRLKLVRQPSVLQIFDRQPRQQCSHHHREGGHAAATP
jgi:predicted RNA methylase